MNTTLKPTPSRLLSVAFAALLTLAMLGGIDRLATPADAPAQLAAQPTQAQA